MMDLEAAFDKFHGEYGKFDRVADKLHPRPDICAFLLLDKLCPDPGRDIIGAASHDEIWLSPDAARLAEAAAEGDILTLVRCGVRYDDDNGSLCMFA